ncbi:hypothetical protein GE21DRAFT_1292609 [Neurospora crassa]|nr:hypothetical protein GE21DRAFT_1292609 [Neurospora crassa]
MLCAMWVGGGFGWLVEALSCSPFGLVGYVLGSINQVVSIVGGISGYQKGDIGGSFVKCGPIADPSPIVAASITTL